MLRALNSVHGTNILHTARICQNMFKKTPATGNGMTLSTATFSLKNKHCYRRGKSSAINVARYLLSPLSHDIRQRCKQNTKDQNHSNAENGRENTRINMF